MSDKAKQTDIEQAIDILEVTDSNRCAICSGRLNRCFVKEQEPCGLHDAYSLAISALKKEQAVHEYCLEMNIKDDGHDHVRGEIVTEILKIFDEECPIGMLVVTSCRSGY